MAYVIREGTDALDSNSVAPTSTCFASGRPQSHERGVDVYWLLNIPAGEVRCIVLPLEFRYELSPALRMTRRSASQTVATDIVAIFGLASRRENQR